jgi:hypothetical protein
MIVNLSQHGTKTPFQLPEVRENNEFCQISIYGFQHCFSLKK